MPTRWRARWSWKWPSSRGRFKTTTAQGKGASGGVGTTVRDTDVNLADAARGGEVTGAAAHEDAGHPEVIVADLDVGPAEPFLPTRPHCLQNRFLGRPPTREMLGSALASLTIGDFPVGVHPAKKVLAVPLDHLANAQTLHDVRAYA